MKTFLQQSSLLLFVFSTFAHSFSVVSPLTKNTSFKSTVTLRSTESNEKSQVSEVPIATGTETNEDVAESSISWVDMLDPKLVADMKAELIQKYKDTGLDEAEAQKQTEEFLSNRDQAEKYIEMRMFSAAVADDYASGGGTLQLFGGFFFGFAAIAGPKLFAAFQASQSATGQ